MSSDRKDRYEILASIFSFFIDIIHYLFIHFLNYFWKFLVLFIIFSFKIVIYITKWNVLLSLGRRDEPKQPIDPDKPTEPDKPIEPEQPIEPDKPNEPEQPSEPDKPTELDKPVEPEQPETPAQLEIKTTILADAVATEAYSMKTALLVQPLK